MSDASSSSSPSDAQFQQFPDGQSSTETKNSGRPPTPRATGDRWTDLKLAVQRISVWDDLKNIGEVLCARKSLLTGIMSGAGIGFVRGWSTSIFAGSNWAIGTFTIVSLGVWQVCQASVSRERETVKTAIEHMAQRRFMKQEGGGPADAGGTQPSGDAKV